MSKCVYECVSECIPGLLFSVTCSQLITWRYQSFSVRETMVFCCSFNRIFECYRFYLAIHLLYIQCLNYIVYYIIFICIKTIVCNFAQLNHQHSIYVEIGWHEEVTFSKCYSGGNIEKCSIIYIYNTWTITRILSIVIPDFMVMKLNIKPHARLGVNQIFSV